MLARDGLVRGETIGIDATTLEANAALRSIVRRDTGEAYEEFLTKLARESGIKTPTRADLARLDRKRSKKGRNQDWGIRTICGPTSPSRIVAAAPEAESGRAGAVYANLRRIRGARGRAFVAGQELKRLFAEESVKAEP